MFDLNDLIMNAVNAYHEDGIDEFIHHFELLVEYINELQAEAWNSGFNSEDYQNPFRSNSE